MRLIKNASDDLVRRPELRADSTNESPKADPMAIIKMVGSETQRMTPREVFEEVRKLGLRMPDESTAIVRADRDRD